MGDIFWSYWSGSQVQSNVLVILNLLGALALGLLVGYERSFHGRAAGMRTYGLVCMASAALTVIVGYAPDWYGGTTTTPADVSRVVQGIVTGIGFLCGGVIMRDNFSISGLTTAASLWAASVIGVLVGVGFYLAAIALALLCTLSMVWILWIEDRLPTHPGIAIQITFERQIKPDEARLIKIITEHGYSLNRGSVDIEYKEGSICWTFLVVALDRVQARPISDLAHAIQEVGGIHGFQLHHARN
jgi:putative Mg2+ transporter-C (MgtC) family protein